MLSAENDWRTLISWRQLNQLTLCNQYVINWRQLNLLEIAGPLWEAFQKFSESILWCWQLEVVTSVSDLRLSKINSRNCNRRIQTNVWKTFGFMWEGDDALEATPFYPFSHERMILTFADARQLLYRDNCHRRVDAVDWIPGNAWKRNLVMLVLWDTVT